MHKLHCSIREQIENSTKAFTGQGMNFKAITSPTIKVIAEASLERFVKGTVVTDLNQDKFVIVDGYTIGNHFCLELYPVPKDY